MNSAYNSVAVWVIKQHTNHDRQIKRLIIVRYNAGGSRLHEVTVSIQVI